MEFAIYNLYPRLIGKIDAWYSHVERISNMGFSWIYINPIMASGFSGSLYAIKDYYEYNQMFFENPNRLYAEKDIKKFTDHCQSMNINVMLDIVINHSSKDSLLTTEQYNWYKRDENGELVSPGAWDNGEWISWGDLAEFDNAPKDDNSHLPLWQYWRDFIDNAMYLGFRGFRCDAAYKVPSELWKYLIDHAKSKDPNVIFFAESLGCSLEDSVALAESGFDYLASSAKWWDYTSEWFIEQYETTRKLTKSITFVENHDTLRAITEYNGNIEQVKQAMSFTALVGNAWVMTSGFEYGAKNRCHVVCDTVDNAENIHYDISDYIKRFIDYMKTSTVSLYNGELETIDIYGDDFVNTENNENGENNNNYDNNDNYNNDNNCEHCDNPEKKLERKTPIKAFYKYNDDKTSKLLIVLNTTEKQASFNIAGFGLSKDVSFENKLDDSVFELNEQTNNESVISFNAYQIKVFECSNA